jgi:D-lactate dehydrogenase
MQMPELEKELLKIFPPQRVKTRLIDVVAYASDAGFYHLQPKAVVQPVNEAEVVQLFQLCHRLQVPVTFRTGGSSLSGQSITNGILADLSIHWRNYAIKENGASIWLQPGVIGSVANQYLKKYQRKIGPDPSSINTAMVGGILSNNASGMCCGVALNSYHTVKDICFVLTNGASYNTAVKEDYTRFEKEQPALFTGLADLHLQVNNSALLLQRIRQKYLTKNTVGYSINALADYQHPLDIFAHLLIGAEGTLAFIAHATLQSVPDYASKATALLFFATMKDACDAIVPITNTGAEMIELMDRASLRSIEHCEGIPALIKDLPPAAAALLVEYQEDTMPAVEKKIKAFDALTQLPLLYPVTFTTDTGIRELYWKIRKGMFPSVGAVRARGTTVILEDIAFPVAQLAAALHDLQGLFEKYKYDNAIVFGHAKDGNIHFVVTQSFNTKEEISRYECFMEEVVALVVKKYDGALKAEHGTGRNMAPFVETEWGGEAYEIMKRIKALADPQNILNPGVIINENKKAHITHLKQLPAIEEEVDKCIECGYCEQKCPSRDITLTPRRRIVVRRGLALLKAASDTAAHKTLLQQYQYDGLDTCAVDGLCATECPVDINTGNLVKRLRSENHSTTANKTALYIARHYKATEQLIKLALRSGLFINKLFGKQAMTGITTAIKQAIPSFPKWMEMQGGPVTRTTTPAKTGFIYFTTCITRCMGSNPNGTANVIDSLLSVAAKAGISLSIPAAIKGICCGQPFSSKGYKDAAVYTQNKTIEWLYQQTQKGALPVITDMSSCTHTLKDCRVYLTPANQQKFDVLTILDAVDFLHDVVLPGLKITRPKEKVALHPVCSLTHLKNQHKLMVIAKTCAKEVQVPVYAGCCGMAGDRGMQVPALTKAAVAMETAELKHSNCSGHYSSAKTCEMALSENSGLFYESVANLLNEVSV